MSKEDDCAFVGWGNEERLGSHNLRSWASFPHPNLDEPVRPLASLFAVAFWHNINFVNGWKYSVGNTVPRSRLVTKHPTISDFHTDGPWKKALLIFLFGRWRSTFALPFTSFGRVPWRRKEYEQRRGFREPCLLANLYLASPCGFRNPGQLFPVWRKVCKSASYTPPQAKIIKNIN